MDSERVNKKIILYADEKLDQRITLVAKKLKMSKSTLLRGLVEMGLEEIEHGKGLQLKIKI